MFDKVYIDGDWLLYLIASICEDNYIEVKDSNNKISEYKNITTFKEFLKDKGLPFIKEDYEIESKKRLKPGDVQMKGIFSLKGKIGKIRRDSLAKDVVTAKKFLGMEIYDKSREDEVHNQVLKLAKEKDIDGLLGAAPPERLGEQPAAEQL